MSDPCTCSECNAKQNRIAAFGAIRRAAAVARDHDKSARFYNEQGNSEGRVLGGILARNTRRAIRAAIGSDKA